MHSHYNLHKYFVSTLFRAVVIKCTTIINWIFFYANFSQNHCTAINFFTFLPFLEMILIKIIINAFSCCTLSLNLMLFVAALREWCILRLCTGRMSENRFYTNWLQYAKICRVLLIDCNLITNLARTKILFWNLLLN